MNNELYHHGVLGMKWGVRKARRGLNKLYKLDKKKNNAWVKTVKKPSAYREWKYDGALNPMSKTRKVDRQVKRLKRLEKRLGAQKLSNLNTKQLYAGRAYCLQYVD